MSKVLHIDINPDIVLPDTCDNMPDELRGQLLVTMSHAMNIYDCKQEDLRWSVKKGIIRVKLADD